MRARVLVAGSSNRSASVPTEADVTVLVVVLDALLGDCFVFQNACEISAAAHRVVVQ